MATACTGRGGWRARVSSRFGLDLPAAGTPNPKPSTHLVPVLRVGRLALRGHRALQELHEAGDPTLVLGGLQEDGRQREVRRGPEDLADELQGEPAKRFAVESNE